MTLKKIENPELFRNNIRKKINEILKNEKNSSNLEKGIFNYSLKEAQQKKVIKKWDNHLFVQIYISHLRSIITNLRGEILQKINDGSLKPHLVAFMTHHEMRPEKWLTLIDAKSKRDKNKFEVNMAASTDTFTCRKCKGNQCTYYFQQVRSSDEPMTCYISCILCGNRWKQN
jgi:DNA-directed RNA polymerase subunit M/transcription elongation factor TFIIS